MENREFYIDSDGIPLHAKLTFPDAEADRYPLLIIVHGYTGHMEEPHILGAAEAANAQGFAALRVEMYGHGQSGGTFEKHTILKWVNELVDVIDYAAGLDFVSGLYLTGHSAGGLTVMLAAGLKQDVLKALIPLSPAICIIDGAKSGDMLGITFDPDHVPDRLPAEDHGYLGGNYVRTAQLLPLDEAIRKYTGPVLIIHGDEDETVPVSYAYDAARKYADAELAVISGDTHCFDYHLDQMLGALTAFLDRFS